MKIITVETLKMFLDELNKKYGTEFYTRAEADNKYQSKGGAYTKAESDARYQPKVESSGGSVDYAELARRIPSWQWKVTMPKTVNQTVTATVNGKTYTSDFYAQQGSNVTFSARADAGYIEGVVSPKNTTLTGDLTVTVTAATESENIEAGTKSFGDNDSTFIVPPKVHVLKWTWNLKDTYTRVKPGQSFNINVEDMGGQYSLIRLSYSDNDRLIIVSGDINDNDDSTDPLFVSWSTKINGHGVDHDWSGGGNNNLSGKLELDWSKGNPAPWTVPDGVGVLKATGYDGMVVYAKVSPSARFEFDKTNEYAQGAPGEPGSYFDIFKIIYTNTQSYLGWQEQNPDARKMRATLEWSPEINDHAVDADLTKPGVVHYITF